MTVYLPLNGVDEANFSHSDGTDDMDPPGNRERETPFKNFRLLKIQQR